MRPTIDHRPNPYGAATNVPDRIVVHVMGEYLEYEGERLYAPDFIERIGLSTHVMVTPDGTEIRCRRDSEGAYHAKGYNTNSLGIEMLCADASNLAALKEVTARAWVTGNQFQKTAEIVRGWMDAYDIPMARVVRHSDLDPERKWFDPGDGFPWSLFQDELRRRAA